MNPAPTKSERMELRKAIGNRVITGPQVPPYHRGPELLVAHACFDCRKSWKLSEESSAICPQCGKPVNWMGRAFKAPKKTDGEQWKKVETLWRAGFRFFPNTGWRKAEPYPERLRDVAKFVADNPKHPFRVES
ncbi:hypothetical protein [Sphingopyxis sp. H115]|uniref:hypothetical protein n=1 Tax=Sphingopyxis sp. H115 TaxID=1759073 RepID=UPI00128F3177|nr:hypothetical protein [Sphingopyxis sp. H115]